MCLRIRSLVFLLALSHFHLATSIFVHLNAMPNVSESESFMLYSHSVIYGRKNVGRGDLGVNASYYENLTRYFTLDERCNGGMPLTMAIFPLSPYAENSVPQFNNNKTHSVKVVFWGLFLEILKKIIPHCCHRNSTVEFAKVLLNQFVSDEPAEDFDFTFPLYGETMQDKMYKQNPFVPVIAAPSVALLVRRDSGLDGKTRVIATQILKSVLIFPFIVMLAILAGIIIWLLDRYKNTEEFPNSFLRGVWEGFWWAFITMTTVGYGDRTPKSFFGRLFCFLWILFGLVILSVLSGVMTAGLTASTKTQFKIHGAKIGAVSESKEYLLGISLNAQVIGVPSVLRLFGEVHGKKTIDGMLIDNYVTMKYGKELENVNVRVDRMINHAITYGIRMANGSKQLERCARTYIRDNPQVVFKLLTKNVSPVRNKKDRENLRKKEADKLFRQDSTMKEMLRIGAYVVSAVIFLGVTVQVIMYVRALREEGRKQRRQYSQSELGVRGGSFEDFNESLKEMIEQYKNFQRKWMKKLKEIGEE